MTTVRIEIVDEVDTRLVEAFGRLIPQLSSSSAPVSSEDLTEIVASPATVLFVARDGDRSDDVLGALTLVLFRIPTGMRAWIEDVVVDEASSGKGIGAALNEAAIEHARGRGARTVDLTSRPSREAANRLYRRLGFVERETHVYRLSL